MLINRIPVLLEGKFIEKNISDRIIFAFMKLNYKLIGAGIVLAAAGVGAGDVVASAVSGASFGLALLWALLIGAIFKYFLNEGMARYQLATKKTFMEGFTSKFKGFNYYFLVYLVIWSFIVGGALLLGIGFVSNAMFSNIPTWIFAIIMSLLALFIVKGKSYAKFERVMKFFAIVMFISFLFSAIVVFPSFITFFKGLLIPTIPNMGSFFNSAFKVLALLGGVGGTVTIMAYSYWIREKNIISPKQIKTVRWDLIIGYGITFIFGMCVMIIASTFIGSSQIIEGKAGVMLLANSLQNILGPVGFWIFSLGFWSAIFSSLLSFYDAIPYLFADSMRLIKNESDKKLRLSKYYKWYQLFCVFPPMLLLFLQKPFFLILSYSVLGAFFMPFIALMILIIGNSKKLGNLRNKWWDNTMMVLVFLVMIIVSFWPLIQKYIL